MTLDDCFIHYDDLDYIESVNVNRKRYNIQKLKSFLKWSEQDKIKDKMGLSAWIKLDDWRLQAGPTYQELQTLKKKAMVKKKEMKKLEEMFKEKESRAIQAELDSEMAASRARIARAEAKELKAELDAVKEELKQAKKEIKAIPGQAEVVEAD